MAKKRHTVSDIKTAIKAKVRSKPRAKGSEYLEIFVLEKNKARLEQEKENVEKRREQIEKDISAIGEEIEALGAKVPEIKGATVNTEKHKKKLIYPKPMKMMKIEY